MKAVFGTNIYSVVKVITVKENDFCEIITL